MPLVQQIEEAVLPRRHRRWTGNDASRREHHACVPLAPTPIYMRLSWRKDNKSRPVHLADLRLDLQGLLAEGYVRRDGAGHVRLRFCHETTGKVFIQTKSVGPRLVVGST